MTRLYVVDAGSLAGRFYFSTKGEPDGMLIGIEDWLRSFREEIKPPPTHLVMCLDAGRDARKAIDPSYKSGRDKRPEEPDLIDQLKRLPTLLSRLHVPYVKVSGQEADDVIASIIAHVECDEYVVVSSDGDLAALVTDNVSLYDPRADKNGAYRWWDVAGVRRHIGVPPWRVADMLAIGGDASDSIVGIKGVGDDTAVKAIAQTKSMAELFRKAAAGELQDIKPHIQKKLAEGREQYEHALRLTTLFRNLIVPTRLDTFKLEATTCEKTEIENTDSVGENGASTAGIGSETAGSDSEDLGAQS